MTLFLFTGSDVMSSYATESSVASVTTDLVREESFGFKLFLSASYLTYILSSFAVTFAFCLDFYRNLSEFVASLVLVIVSWIAVAAGNLTLYRTIRPRGRRAFTENAPGTEITAGYCVRLLLTILPFSPVLRWVELWERNRGVEPTRVARRDRVALIKTACKAQSRSKLCHHRRQVRWIVVNLCVRQSVDSCVSLNYECWSPYVDPVGVQTQCCSVCWRLCRSEAHDASFIWRVLQVSMQRKAVVTCSAVEWPGRGCKSRLLITGSRQYRVQHFC